MQGTTSTHEHTPIGEGRWREGLVGVWPNPWFGRTWPTAARPPPSHGEAWWGPGSGLHVLLLVGACLDSVFLFLAL